MTIHELHRYCVFTTAGFQGNPVTLYAVDDLDDDEALFRSACASATLDNVFYELGRDKRLKVRFLTSGYEIQFCGHGLLALANHLGQEEGNGSFGMQAEAPGGRRWDLLSREGSIWIGMPSVPGVTCGANDNPVATLLDILEFQYETLYTFENSTWVATTSRLEALLGFRADLLAMHHGAFDMLGALALTTRLSANCYALRYFAPWYGKTEDSATGSAQGCLAPLWIQDGHRGLVLQYSPHGVANMTVQLDGARVLLTGAVRRAEPLQA